MFKLRSTQDFTTPWKHACVIARIFHCEKYVPWFHHQSGRSGHLHSTRKCYTAVFVMDLLLVDLISTGVNSTLHSKLLWMIRKNCSEACEQIRAASIVLGDYLTSVTSLQWEHNFAFSSSISCLNISSYNHIKHLPDIFFSRKHDSFLLEEARPNYVLYQQ